MGGRCTRVGRYALAVTAGAFALGGCTLMEPQEDPAFVKAQQVETRVDRLERQTQALLDLQRQIQSLQAEVRRLRGDLEQAQFQLESSRQEQRQLYADLDRRLQSAEAGARAAVAGGGVPAAGGVAMVPGAPTAGGDDASAYQAAFDQLRARDYAGAERGFRNFIANYPASPLLDNAKYWLGETYYVEGRYADALNAFQRVVQEHPQSRRIADALLKAGFAEYELGRYREARDFLNRVVAEHGDLPAAEQARERLRRLDAEGR